VYDSGRKAACFIVRPLLLIDRILQNSPGCAPKRTPVETTKFESGSLELTGTVQTLVGQAPSAVTSTPLPPLGNDVSQPGTFDVLLPVRVSYDALRDKIMQLTDIGGLADDVWSRG
jgi:hypothetical protein